MKPNQTKPHYSKKRVPLSRGDAHRAEEFFSLKVVLVQDYIKEFGGAESVLESLSEIFPDAPIFTTLYKPEFLGPHRDRLEKKWGNRIHQSFFKYIPFAYKIISPLRLLSPLAFNLMNFKNFDLIITSATGAYFPNLINKKNTKLICYCHTPPRYLYGLPTARNFTKNKIIYALVSVLNHFLRKVDFKSAQNVDQFIANSQTTADRIKKFYGRDAIIINPPIDLPKNFIHKSKIINHKSYFLSGGRLARAKRYDIAIEACKLAKVPLKIFGRDFAGYESELRKISNSTIEFLGEINQEEKAKLYSNAKAFIFCSDNEDFGIVPVESMSYGCPVVAYKSGGTTETVIADKTGIFFDELNSVSCAAAIKKLQKSKINSQDCISRAAEFSTEKFVKKIKKLIF